MRSLLSITAGLAVGLLAIFLVDMVITSLNSTEIQFHQKLFDSNPIKYFLLDSLVTGVGTFLASFISAMVARSMRFQVGILTATILLTFAYISVIVTFSSGIFLISQIFISMIIAFVGANIGATRRVG